MDTLTRLTRLGPEEGENFEFSWTNGYLAAHLISDVGRKREHNEDSCVICAPEKEYIAEERGNLFAVADGMGGASAGERASRVTLSTITERYYSDTELNIPKRLMESVQEANARVFKEAERNPAYHGMGTTVSAVLVAKDCAYVAQVGDSRVYVWRQNHMLYQITEDHSLVAEQVKSGIISEEEARNHSLKNLITRAVGIKDDVDVDLFSFRLKRGDTILVCSDGLCGMVNDDEIEQAMKLDDLRKAARVLVGKALEEGGSDNISVAVVRVIDAPPRGEMQEGCKAVVIPSLGFFGKLARLLTG